MGWDSVDFKHKEIAEKEKAEYGGPQEHVASYQDAANEGDFKYRGNHVKHDRCQHEVHAPVCHGRVTADQPRASIDGPLDSAGLAGEVEGVVEGQEMPEELLRDFLHGALGDLG